MALENAKHMLLKATRQGYAVGAFNVTNVIQLEAAVEAAAECSSPVIVQTSVTPSKFLRAEVIAAICRILAEDARIPVCLHLDHCDEVDYCKACATAGYTNIMIDASRHDFEENVRQTKEVVDFCHSLGDITVEGELGTVCGVEDQISYSGQSQVETKVFSLSLESPEETALSFS
jgi:ketose-bisphosphate aldolase